MPARLMLCHDCDLPNRVGYVPPAGSVRCSRCDGLLQKNIPDSLNRTLAFALAGMVLFVVANSFPFLALKMQGLVTHTTLASGVEALYRQDQPLVATLVLFTTILAPFAQLLALLYVMGSLKLGIVLPERILVFRLLHRAQAWSMMEVFLIGILVSLVKLIGMAQIVPGIALWSFVALIPILAAAHSSLDADRVWGEIGGAA